MAGDVATVALAAPTKDTLTCYVNAEFDEAGPASNTVEPHQLPSTGEQSQLLVNPYADVDDTTTIPFACMSYAYDTCASPGANCSAEDAQQGMWRWVYTYASVTECQLFHTQHQQNPNSLHNFTCCVNDLCNAPNPSLDLYTTIKPHANDNDDDNDANGTALTCWINMGTAPGAAPAVALMPYPGPSPVEDLACGRYQFACTANDTGCSEHVTDGQAFKWAYVFVEHSDCQYMADHSDVYINVNCCSSDGCNRPDPALDSLTVVHDNNQPAHTADTTGGASLNSSLSCWINTRVASRDVTLMSYPGPFGDFVCGRYQFACSENNPVISQVEIDARAFKWAYLWLPNSTCAELAQYPALYVNSYCCGSDGCNQPDLALDNSTVMLTGNGQSVSGAGGDLNGTTIQPDYQAPGHWLQGETLTCWENIARGTNQPHMPAVSPVTMPAMSANGERQVCAWYEVICTESGGVCSSADVSGDVWKWGYSSLSTSDCEVLKSDGRRRNVHCCSSNGCNLPNLTLDATTELVLIAAPPEYDNLTCYTSVDMSEPDLQPAVYACGVHSRLLLSVVEGERSVAEPTVCASYKYLICPTTTQNTTGSAASVGCAESGAAEWKTAYLATPVSTCYRQRWQAQNNLSIIHQGSTPGEDATELQKEWHCCALDRCNSPQEAQDNETIVLMSPATDTLSCYTSNISSLVDKVPEAANMPPMAYSAR